LKDKKIFNSKI